MHTATIENKGKSHASFYKKGDTTILSDDVKIREYELKNSE